LRAVQTHGTPMHSQPMKTLASLKTLLSRCNLPTLSLIAFLQRAPVVQTVVTLEDFVVESPIGTLLKSAAAVFASLGAINSMAGASTTLTVSGTGGTINSAGATLTVGTAAQIAFSIPGSSGWSDPAGSWTATGVPAGMTVDGSTATGKISGTPTTATTATATLVVHSVSGSYQQSYSYPFTVTGSAAGAPTITTQPVSQTVSVGSSVTFSVVATGTPTPTYQWRKDSTNIAGETAASLALSNVQTTAAGTYTVVVTNTAGSVTSSGAVLTVNPAAAGAPSTPPSSGAFASSPTEVTVTWQPPVTGTATGYKLERAADSGFTNALTTFNLGASTSYVDTTAAAGTTYFYRLSAVNASGASAPTAAMQVQTPASVGGGASHFVNIATRAFSGAGNNVTIGGFVVTGSTPKRVLIRGVGPSLSSQGLSSAEVLADPTIEVHQGSPVIASNDNWGDNANAAEITSVAAQIGATALASGDTKSAALLITLSPGVYSFIVSGKGGTSGIVLLEVYDADTANVGSSFVNIATRADSTAGNGVTIGGFVVSGSAPKNVLIRAVGPTLTTEGIGQTEVLTNPVIELHQGSAVIATNDNWGDNANAAQIMTTGARIGATPFANTDTNSAALLLKLQPGVCSFIASGKGSTSGIVLVEVYDAD